MSCQRAARRLYRIQRDKLRAKGIDEVPMKRRVLARPISVLASILAPILAPLAAGCTDEPPPEPMLVTIRTGEPPALLAFRDQASSKWQAVATAGASTFEVNVRGRYEVVIVCEEVSWSTVIVWQLARTPLDEPLIRMRCNSIDDPGDVPVREPFVVRGTMVQPGLLALGTSSADGVSPNWSFELPTAAGSFDLVMFSEGASGDYDQLAIRRGIAIAGDTDLGVIDLGQEGVQPLVWTPLFTTNLEPDEALYSTVMFQTSSSGIGLGQSGLGMRLAPQGILQATDQQWAEVYAVARQFSSSGITRERTRSTVALDVRPSEPATVTLPDSLGQVTFQMTADRLVAEWSSLPEHAQLWLGSFSVREDLQLEHSFWPSPAFIEATGATSATLDLRNVPGFKSAWLHDPADDWYRVLSAERFTSAGDSAVSSVSESATPMSAARAARAQATVRAAMRDAMLHER